MKRYAGKLVGCFIGATLGHLLVRACTTNQFSWKQSVVYIIVCAIIANAATDLLSALPVKLLKNRKEK